MILLQRILFLSAAGVCAAFGQLSNRVLVVHNTTVPDSVSVADYYVAQRAIPAANRCAITTASTTAISLGDYQSLIQAPIRACLNNVGSQNILYIVMTYGVPYVLT